MQSIVRNYNQRLILARGVFVYSTRAHPRAYVFDSLCCARRYSKGGIRLWVLRFTVCSVGSW